MKRIVLLLLMSIAFYGAMCQDISGKWKGVVRVKKTKFNVVFRFAKTPDGYITTLDSPDYGAKGYPINSVKVNQGQLNMAMSIVRIEYNGKIYSDAIHGSLTFNGRHYPMWLTRVTDPVPETKVKPAKPASGFYTENVTFLNTKSKILLAGTLTLPKKTGNYPIVVLVSGYGPDDRDEEKYLHRPFQVLAEYLTMNGIGVLRYDDRGVGLSKGEFRTATTDDFKSDVESALDYLKKRPEIDKKKMALIGHGEGGLIAAMIAAKSSEIKCIAMLGAPGMRGDNLMILRAQSIAAVSGASDDDLMKIHKIYTKVFRIISDSTDKRVMKEDVTDFLNMSFKKIPDSNGKPRGMSFDQYVDTKVDELTNPWMLNYIKLDPVFYLETVKCPVLVLHGEKDLEVPTESNILSIKNAFNKAQNNDVTIKVLPKLNHLFQECKTGLPSEYPSIPEIISTSALDEISDWVAAHMSK
jgi:uncharacterized protein